MYLQGKDYSFIDHKTQASLTVPLKAQHVKTLSLGGNLQSASAGLKQRTYILLRVGVIIDWVLVWLLDLIITDTHDSEIQTLPLIPTIHKSHQHSLSLFQPAVFTSRFLVMASNSGDSSASRTQFILHRLQYVTD
jgi:hypothetical protein